MSPAFHLNQDFDIDDGANANYIMKIKLWDNVNIIKYNSYVGGKHNIPLPPLSIW